MLKILLTIYVILLSTSGFAQDLLQAPAAVQISSTVSDGKLTTSEIISTCRAQGIKIVVLTDRDLMRWEYGLWPLRNILKKTVEDKSVFRYGINRYFQEIARLARENPDMVIIPGVESAPYYHWEGSIFNRDLKISDWHKHIIGVGLTDPKAYARLPVVGNSQGLLGSWNLRGAFFLLLNLSIALIGISLLFKRKFSYADSRGKALGPLSRPWQITGGVIVVISCVVLGNNFYYRNVIFSTYGRNAGMKPYQNYIDYVDGHGALAFWSNPQAKNIDRQGMVRIETQPHASDLLATSNYTGFAIFYEGYEGIGEPGGIWDTLLKQYCRGVRSKPVWAIGGLSFDSGGDLAQYLQDLRTVLLVKGVTSGEVLRALGSGAMYVARGKDSSEFILDQFAVVDERAGATAQMGGQIVLNAAPKIIVRGHYIHGQNQALKLKLIKDGKVTKVFEAVGVVDIVYIEDNPGPGKSYYRLEIEASGLQVVTNPIFVEQSGRLPNSFD